MSLFEVGAVLGSLLFSSLTAWATPTTVHVRHEAQIALSNVQLGAIADIKSTDESYVRALNGLVLGESPKVDQATEWSAAEVSKRLRPYNRLFKEVVFKIPERVKLRRVASPFAREAIKNQIEQSLKATLPDSSWEARLLSLDMPSELNVPHNGSVQVVPLSSRPRGQATFEVQIMQNDRIVERKWLNGRVQFLAAVATLKRDVTSRAKISDRDVTWLKRDFTFNMDVPAQRSDLDAAVTKMALKSGSMVLRSQLERELAVRFGDEVDVMAGDDSFSVTIHGIAQQNGYIGDSIKVKTTGNKTLTGILASRGTINVRY